MRSIALSDAAVRDLLERGITEFAHERSYRPTTGYQAGPQMGEVLAVKETYGVLTADSSQKLFGKYLYRADYPETLTTQGFWCGSGRRGTGRRTRGEWAFYQRYPTWRKPTTMPQDAIRLYVRVTSQKTRCVSRTLHAECVRTHLILTRISEEEAIV